jgi:hypothetical protein
MPPVRTVPRQLGIAGLVAALISGGCATAPSDIRGRENAGTPSTASAPLARGASAQAVIQALGKPDKIEPVKENPAAVIWTYYRPVETRVRAVEATMQDRVVFDPLNRETAMKTIQEPVHHTQRVVVEEVLVLIMVHDALSDWRKSYREVAASEITR